MSPNATMLRNISELSVRGTAKARTLLLNRSLKITASLLPLAVSSKSTTSTVTTCHCLSPFGGMCISPRWGGTLLNAHVGHFFT
eukprot:3989107-Prymnesium_polylepis.1